MSHSAALAPTSDALPSDALPIDGTALRVALTAAAHATKDRDQLRREAVAILKRTLGEARDAVRAEDFLWTVRSLRIRPP